jgi:hypothetical protein
LTEKIAEELERCLSIVDVPTPILDPQDMSSLREVGRDRVVARHLPVVRVVASSGSLDLETGRDHGSIDVDGDSAKVAPFDRTSDELRVEVLEGSNGLLPELLQPAAQSAISGKNAQTAEATHNRISLEEANVLETTPSNDEESDEEQHHRDERKVPAKANGTEVAAKGFPESALAEVLANDLEAGVGGETRDTAFELKRTVDSEAEIALSSSHRKWPFVCGLDCLVTSKNHGERPFCNPQIHFIPLLFDGSRLTHTYEAHLRQGKESPIRRATP